MNLFVLGWSRDRRLPLQRARDSIAALVGQLPIFDPEHVRTWLAPSGRSGVAWVTQGADRVGGVRYVFCAHDCMALFAGRPFRWVSEAAADGHTPLDARWYLDGDARWADSLDGRCAVATYDDRDGRLLLYGDALGGYPVYHVTLEDTLWVSNNAEVLRALVGDSGVDPLAMASLLAGGWSINGDPIWRSVRRMPAGTLDVRRRDRPAKRVKLLPVERIRSLLGIGLDPDAAAATLVAAVGAIADWPGRPSVLQLSGGRDSRLLLAASIASGFDFDVLTVGGSTSPDVQIAGALADAVHVPYATVGYDPDGALFEALGATARTLMLMSSGTVCLADTGGFFRRRRNGALPLWHNGQGGEIARAYYGTGAGLDRRGLVAHLWHALTGEQDSRRARVVALGRRLGRRDRSWGLVNRDAEALVAGHLRDWIDDQLAAGVPAADVPDVFYLVKRMPCWAGPGHSWLEFGKGDSAPGLWGSRMLRHELGGTARERRHGAFHARTLEVLSPRLARLPYADELAEDGAADDPLLAVAGQIRDAVLSYRSHPAWAVLSRRTVERVLASDPARLDDVTREYSWKPAMWRLATVFLGSPA